MFAYATDEGKCFGGKCKCVCTTGAYVNGTCDAVEKTGYNLYTYVTESSALLVANITDETGNDKMYQLIMASMIQSVYKSKNLILKKVTIPTLWHSYKAN